MILSIVFYLSVLFQFSESTPVRTILCCCGCTEHPCPMVGPNCPPPTTICTNSSSDIQCSEVQHLFDISHNYDDLEDSTEDISARLLPSLDSVDLVLHNNLDVTPMQKIEGMMGTLESTIHQLRSEISKLETTSSNSTQKAKKDVITTTPVDQLARQTKKTFTLFLHSFCLQIDASLQPVRRTTREKRLADMSENCNDDKLKKIIMENIKKDAKSSKREIQKAANKQFGGHFNVICSPCEFSFVVASQKYCDGFKDNVACFAFLQPPTKLKIEE
ncbi:unnamed protein product [Caenorhabditis angaria]|uniref:Ground-like domain-containing protein n=1 Tax=Caenorhabditis angaria TaxID=860376 RepID=A0A9P1ITG5_9PELO|nr:unnamed protein product [Caenorhabditis angaria]